jgi:hypothetical protein
VLGKLLFVMRDFYGDRLKMMFYFLQMFLDPALVLFEQLQAFGHGLLTLAAEFGIALDIANLHKIRYGIVMSHRMKQFTVR